MLSSEHFPEPHSELNSLFVNNDSWVERVLQEDPNYFKRLQDQQKPRYLWIGCSDSRVPANQITGLPPGEIFVHRNIANVVVHTDLNCLSVLQFGIECIKIEHVIVVGHYGCSGVGAALAAQRVGLADNWLRHVQDVRDKHQTLLAATIDDSRHHQQLVELNVLEQVINVCNTTTVQDAWGRQQKLTIHGWVYGIHDGRLRNLGLSVNGNAILEESYQRAISQLAQRYRQ